MSKKSTQKALGNSATLCQKSTGPVEQQHRLAHAIHQQPAVRVVQHRQPGLELGIHLEGIILVIEEDTMSLAGVDSETAKTLLLQDIAGTLLKGVEMLGKSWL